MTTSIALVLPALPRNRNPIQSRGRQQQNRQRIGRRHHAQRRVSTACVLVALLVTLGLTRETDVNPIIADASRAFALSRSLLRCAVAKIVAVRQQQLPNRQFRVIGFKNLPCDASWFSCSEHPRIRSLLQADILLGRHHCVFRAAEQKHPLPNAQP